MKQNELLWKLEGLHTVETAMQMLGITRPSALNLLCRLKKKGYVSTSGGGKQVRLYKITMRKQRPHIAGMFDIINKYSPMKLSPWYDHQVHGHYGPEEALIDAIHTKSFRVILASLRLFNHITDWQKLHRLAKQKDCWSQLGAMYDVAKLFMRVRKMPAFPHTPAPQWRQLTTLRKKNFPDIANQWHIYIPFNRHDLAEA